MLITQDICLIYFFQDCAVSIVSVSFFHMNFINEDNHISVENHKRRNNEKLAWRKHPSTRNSIENNTFRKYKILVYRNLF